jgi:hypothetical protein
VAGKDRNRPVKIEFEYESRNFLRHMHDPAKCDIIVCWEHNWPECPLEVIELKKEIGRLRVIEEIARKCQNCQRSPKLEGKTLPLISTDNTDLKEE